MRRWISAWSAVFVAFLALSAHADTVSTYAEHDFGHVTDPYTTTDSADTAFGVFTDEAGNLTGWDFVFSVDQGRRLSGLAAYKDPSSNSIDVSYNWAGPAGLMFLGMGMLGACLLLPSPPPVLSRAKRPESRRPPR